ncbi:MAG: hypothetical protein ACE361_14185 [Aureliella sp.]
MNQVHSRAAVLVRTTLWSCFFFLLLSGDISADVSDEFSGLRYIDRIEFGERAVQQLFRDSQGERCEVIPKGEPLEISSYVPVLTNLDRRKPKSQRISASRRTAFTVGLEFGPDDRSDLPTLSQRQILAFVDSHFLALQTRVRRDYVYRKPFFHHRPIAVLAKYRGSRVSQTLEPILKQTVNDFHGLGLFVTESQNRKNPENLRTMVLLFRTPMLTGKLETYNYEYVFVLGEEEPGGRGGLLPHVFVTTEDRSELHYLRESRRPVAKSQASILGKIAITDFDSSGLVPTSSATRSFRLLRRTKFDLQELDEKCRELGRTGGLGANLTFVLDGIRTGTIRP